MSVSSCVMPRALYGVCPSRQLEVMMQLSPGSDAVERQFAAVGRAFHHPDAAPQHEREALAGLALVEHLRPGRQVQRLD